MSSIVVSHWYNADASAHSNYAHSYILRQGQKELYRVDLNMERGFFELSEFVDPSGEDNFMLEQINQSKKVKVNVFDKHSGSQIAVLCGNTFKNEDEQAMVELHRLQELSESVLCRIDADSSPDDYAALTSADAIAALLIHLPKPSECHAGFFSRISRWAKNISDTPKDVLEVQIIDATACSLRALCALAVIVHARRGLQLPNTWQDASNTAQNSLAP